MFSDDLAVRVDAAEPAWELARAAPELAERLGPRARAAAAALRDGVPVLREIGATRTPPYVRPPGHRRAFYIELDEGVVAIKGSEPLSSGFPAFVDELARTTVHIECRLGSPAQDITVARAELRGLDKFPLVEGKVPCCVTLREAQADAAAAAAVQQAYLARFGELARLPVPLFVGRWPDSVAAQVLDQLRPRLRGRARDVVELSVAAGLGVYAYAYPSVPLRLAHLATPDARRGADVRPRLAALARGGDPRLVLERWVELTARLLAIGFVPSDPASIVTGDCLQVQNAVLDGGFADVESLVASSLLDDRALRGAVRHSVHELALTATRLLYGLWTSTVEMRDRLPDIYATVWSDVGARLRAHAPADARIAAILAGADGLYDRLATLLEESF